jgi:hypothetical protein
MNPRFSGRLSAALAVAGLAACSDGSNALAPQAGLVPTAGVAAQRAAATFPGQSAKGVAAHYVVFARKVSSTSSTIDVISVQEVASYEVPFGSRTTRLHGAVVEYADGSKQSADAHAEFDAGASSYAQAHPEPLSGKDIAVRVHPPKGSTLASTVATIFAPSETEEQKIVSGVIPSDLKPFDEGSASAAVWSCNPKDYAAKVLQIVTPNRLVGYSYAVNDETVWYQQHFYTCGTDKASTRIRWSAAHWEHIGAGFGTNAHTRWSLDYITDRFYGDEIALSARPSDPSFADLHLALIGQ